MTNGGTEAATGSTWLASSFGTASSSYQLDSVVLLLENPVAGVAEVDIFSDGGSQPGSLIGKLTSPSSYLGPAGRNDLHRQRHNPGGRHHLLGGPARGERRVRLGLGIDRRRHWHRIPGHLEPEHGRRQLLVHVRRPPELSHADDRNSDFGARAETITLWGTAVGLLVLGQALHRRRISRPVLAYATASVQ